MSWDASKYRGAEARLWECASLVDRHLGYMGQSPVTKQRRLRTLPDPGYEVDLDEVIDGRAYEAAALVLALECLTSKQRFVIERLYGLLDGQEYTYREVAAAMGVTPQTVQQHEYAALERMRKHTDKTL